MRSLKSILLTGGAGFIGSTLARQLLTEPTLEQLVILDSLTGSGRKEHLIGPDADPRYQFIHGDLFDKELLKNLFSHFQFTGIFHLAAETSTIRSLQQSKPFLSTNISGTALLLDLAHAHQVPLLHCSTDAVYGSVAPPDQFTELSPLAPSSPYAASKASADLLCQAHHAALGTDFMITRSSHNYGSRQAPEHFISQVITHAFHHRPITLDGDPLRIRDWIHVEDHCQALLTVFKKSPPGHIFNIGGHCERTQHGLVRTILQCLDRPESLLTITPSLYSYDLRRASDTTKMQTYFGWKPQHSFQTAIPNLIREFCAQEASLLSLDHPI